MIRESVKLGCPNIELCPLELSSTLSGTERPEPVLRTRNVLMSVLRRQVGSPCDAAGSG